MIDSQINKATVIRFLKAFGENVRRIRLEKNMTVTELANKCNVQRSLITGQQAKLSP